MTRRKSSANAGIEALLGFEFQRNCALYLLLENYDRFKKREFFLCIEHHDDFLFCYRSNYQDKIEEIQSYQAKKLSGAIWTINERFSEAIAKMLEVGNELISDPAAKCQDYTHELTFISNTDVKLAYKPRKDEKTQGKKEISCLLNEQNWKCSYNEMPREIKQTIDKKVETFCKEKDITYHKDQLDNLHIQWIGLPRRADDQKDLLVGRVFRNFPHVSDPKAAVELLLTLFREVEAVYNQGRVIRLLDKTKRIEGSEIK